MAALAGRVAVQDAVEIDECRQGDVGGVHQHEAGAPLARCHPFRDDEPDAVRPGAEERAFSRERSDVLALYLKRLSLERMPRIVDSDRP